MGLSPKQTSRDGLLETLLSCSWTFWNIWSLHLPWQERQQKTCKVLTTDVTHANSISISLARINYKVLRKIKEDGKWNGGHKQDGWWTIGSLPCPPSQIIEGCNYKFTSHSFHFIRLNVALNRIREVSRLQQFLIRFLLFNLKLVVWCSPSLKVLL